jgi:hypothetical protein
MPNNLKISKVKPSEPSMNYEFLHSEGLKYIEKLAHKIWTDYNLHDPGITILELLCYAITDLGYRTSYPIEDILASSEDSSKNLSEQFFSAKTILPTRPVTENDYRKLLLDIEGVINAWLVRHHPAPFYVDCLNSKLSYDNNHLENKVVLKGLYDIMLELEKDKAGQASEIIKKAKAKLHKNRNLCEDFICFNIIEPKEFILCAEIDLAFDADIDEVEASIFYEVQKYLTPPVKFYTLQEMFDKGKRADEIFEGPLLEHGFIDDDELEASFIRNTIRLSDIIQIIMDIEGVLAVRDVIVRPASGEVMSDDKWIIKVNEKGKLNQPVIDVQGSRIVYYKDILPFRADEDKVKDDLQKRRDKEHRKLISSEDIPIPEGQFRDIEQYYSFQNHFPQNYGISQTGLPGSATEKRKARAKQLKAYLLFYDQVLADYFSQLAHVKELFSLNKEVKKTYFTQVVLSVKDVEKDGLYEKDIPQLKKKIQELAEDKDLFFKRRNIFLDHLLARFAENFNEYVWLMYSLNGNQAKEDMIETKLNFLKEYRAISSERGMAFNYRDKDNLWDTYNVSGLEHRLARLLGFENYQRRNLCTPPVSDEEGLFVVEHILLRPINPEEDNFLLICVDKDCSEAENWDPYSFRITIVLPAWPERFSEIDFRRFVEKTIRLETPAHILPRICWINKDQMCDFEEKYMKWLDHHATSPDPCVPATEPSNKRSEALNNFISILSDLRSVYPHATLADCLEKGYPENPFILNRTFLGTKK